MRAISSWIFAPVAGFILLMTAGCKDSAPASGSDLESLPTIPVANDPRAALSSEELSALAKRFVVAPIHTNDVDGIGIVDVQAKEPVWIEWNLQRLGLGRKTTYCFKGKPIMELYFRTTRPFRRDLTYYDDNGRRKLVLSDRTDSGMFTDRIFYEDGTNRYEAWHDGAWHPVEEQNALRITTPSDYVLEQLSSVPVLDDPQAVLSSEELSALAKRFMVFPLLTNGVDGTGIVDTHSKKPIWMEWNFERVGLLHEISYCFQGQPIMGMYVRTNGTTGCDLSYYDADGFQTVLLVDRSGVGEFTDRILYENGTGRMEVWYDEAWHAVEERNSRRGIVIGGQWRPLGISNNLWITTPPE